MWTDSRLNSLSLSHAQGMQTQHPIIDNSTGYEPNATPPKEKRYQVSDKALELPKFDMHQGRPAFQKSVTTMLGRVNAFYLLTNEGRQNGELHKLSHQGQSQSRSKPPSARSASPHWMDKGGSLDPATA